MELDKELLSRVVSVVDLLTQVSFSGSPVVVGPFGDVWVEEGRVVFGGLVSRVRRTAASHVARLVPSNVVAVVDDGAAMYVVYSTRRLRYFSTFASPVLPPGEVRGRMVTRRLVGFRCRGAIVSEPDDVDCEPVYGRAELEFPGRVEGAHTGEPSYAYLSTHNVRSFLEDAAMLLGVSPVIREARGVGEEGRGVVKRAGSSVIRVVEGEVDGAWGVWLVVDVYYAAGGRKHRVSYGVRLG